jgi:hypothetical protein
MKRQIKDVVKGLPYVRRLVAARDRLAAECARLTADRDRLAFERNWLADERDESRAERDRAAGERDRAAAERDELARRLAAAKTWVPLGHYHSPVPTTDEIHSKHDRIFDRSNPAVPGVDLNAAEQLRLLDVFAGFYPDLPWEDQPRPGLRYGYDSPCFTYFDAIATACMMRHLRPRRVIEVGCGHSSAVQLDTSELFLDNAVAFTFIDPHPEERLLDVLKPGDADRVQILPRRLQDIDPGLFAQLAANDILFIDSSHICRTDSDVNFALFEILPALPSGVVVHFHDVLYPFEYFPEWVYEGRAWNEAYALRAFLQYNPAFRVTFWGHYLYLFHRDRVRQAMPPALKNHGGSIWIQKC